MGRCRTRGILVAAGLAAALTAPAVAGEAVRVNGSGAALDVMSVLIPAYAQEHPDVAFVMEKPLGSSGAIKALLAGALDLTVSSKKLTPEQAAQGAQAREYGVTPLVIVTEKKVPRADVTTAELEGIYGGTLTKWADGTPVRVVLRPEGDIDTTILRGLSAGMSAAIDAAQKRPGMITAVTDPESNEAVARMPGGVGASGLCSLLVARPALNALTLNGVPAGVKTLAAGTYPLAKEIRFVTKGAPSPAVAAFLDFAFSPRGRAIAEQSGVLARTGGPTGATR